MDERIIINSIMEKLYEQGKNIDSLSVKSYIDLIKEMDKSVDYDRARIFIKEYIKLIGGRGSKFIFPDNLRWFIQAISKNICISKVLVPHATGFECDLFGSDTNVIYCFQDKETEEGIKSLLSINTVDEYSNVKECSLIFSALSLNYKMKTLVEGGILEKCVTLLSDDGYCIFTFANSIVGDASLKLLLDLEEKGLYCNAIIDVPRGAYEPISRGESKIAVFSKRHTEKLFIGRLSEEIEAEKMVLNFLNKKENLKNSKEGIFVNRNIRCYSEYYMREYIKNKSKILSKKYNGVVHKLSEIGKISYCSPINESVDDENVVYIPLLDNKSAFIESSKVKSGSYIKIKINPEIVLPQYLIFYINSEAGRDILQLMRNSHIARINYKNIKDFPVPCPTISMQKEYIKIYNELESLRVEVEMLKNKLQKVPASYKSICKDMKDLNNHEDKFNKWIEGLPYPIATILKRYSVLDDFCKKQDMIFFFYEACAIFMASILSSAFDKTIMDKQKLKEVDAVYFEKSSFGNWVKMDRMIAKTFMEALNDKNKRDIVLECFKTKNESLVKKICNKKIYNILESTCDLRNRWKGHSGITSEIRYQEHVEVLDAKLTELQEVLGDVYEEIRLIRPIKLSYSNGIYRNKVELLIGSNSIFTNEILEMNKPLDENKLYIQIIDTGETIELPPYFILKNSPIDIKNACYFYNRIESGNSRYVSYHYESRPEEMESGETVFSYIKELLN